jgi:hypothetical protein
VVPPTGGAALPTVTSNGTSKIVAPGEREVPSLVPLVNECISESEFDKILSKSAENEQGAIPDVVPFDMFALAPNGFNGADVCMSETEFDDLLNESGTEKTDTDIGSIVSVHAILYSSTYMHIIALSSHSIRRD